MPNSDKLASVANEYRRGRILNAEQFLCRCCPEEIGLDELAKAFARVHETYPDLSGWIYRNEIPTPRGPGSLEFSELAIRAVSLLVGVSGDSHWKTWLEVLLAYLLQNDTQQEFLRIMGSGGIERQAGTTPTTYAEVQVEGETYEIRHLFKASEHCCSWLKRRFEGTGQSAPADREATEHSHAPGLSLPKEATINDRPRNASAAGVAGTSGKPNRLQQAMAKCGLTVPKLTKKVCEVLRRKQGSKTRVDRATVYRIINGETKNPTEAVWTAILELLHLPADETVDAMMRPADK